MAPQASAPQPVADPLYLTNVLRNAGHFAQREWAARSLAAADWRANPEVVTALLTAARRDVAPTVRAECVHTLVALGVGLIQLDGLFQELKHDPDPRVQHAVDQALTQLATGGGAVN
jgi:hypothetical protein